MMLKILGSILFFSVIGFAQVQLLVQDQFVKGDAVTFTIKAIGKNIVIEPITTIEGYELQNSGVSNNIQIYNDKRTEEKIQRYTFFPDKSVTIPPIKILIDGKEFFTKEKTINITQASKTQSGLYDLNISANKIKAYVGEEIELTLVFKYSSNAKIIDLQFKEPVFENFWSKQYGKVNKYTKNGYFVQELKYLLFPQKAGNLVINPVKLDLAVANLDDPFAFLSGGSNKRLYSNEIPVEVDALPNKIKLIGDFSINANINKQKVKSGEAISFDIIIQGRGNLDDLEDIKLQIPNATIYENKPEKKYNVDENGKYGGLYQKSFSIIAQDDFVIEPIQIEYFDKATNSIKTAQTKRYAIEVMADKNSSNNTQQTLQKLPKKEEVKEEVIIKTIDATLQQKIIYFIFGMIFMIIIVVIIWSFIQKKQQKQNPITAVQVRIKNAKTHEELLKILVIYLGYDEQLDQIIYSLESKNSVELKSLKKEIIQIIERIGL